MNTNRPHWADTAIAIFTGLMLITYITSNYFSCQQLKLTKKTFEEIRKGGADTHDLAVAAKAQADSSKVIAESAKAQADNTETIAQAARTQATAAVNQVARLEAGVKETHALAEASKDSIGVARDNFVKEQSPYIWAKPDPPTPKVGETLNWNTKYSNYGRSVALNLRICGQLHWGLKAGDLAKQMSHDECIRDVSGVRSIVAVPPGDGGYMTMSSDKPLQQADVDVINTNGGLVGVVLFWYDDASGHSYETSFCAYRLGSGAIAHCDKYNYIKQVK
jgi:hypothetical protein